MSLRATNTRGEPTAPPDDIHAGHERIPAPELTDQKPHPHHSRTWLELAAHHQASPGTEPWRRP